MKDPYEILGIRYTASDEEVKRAYKDIIKIYHPDNNVGKSEEIVSYAKQRISEASDAYEEIRRQRSKGNYGPLQEQVNNQDSYDGGNRYRENYMKKGCQYGRVGSLLEKYQDVPCCSSFLSDVWCCSTLCECMGCDCCSCDT